jgi:hypothetical protein
LFRCFGKEVLMLLGSLFIAGFVIAVAAGFAKVEDSSY